MIPKIAKRSERHILNYDILLEGIVSNEIASSLGAGSNKILFEVFSRGRNPDEASIYYQVFECDEERITTVNLKEAIDIYNNLP